MKNYVGRGGQEDEKEEDKEDEEKVMLSVPSRLPQLHSVSRLLIYALHTTEEEDRRLQTADRLPGQAGAREEEAG